MRRFLLVAAALLGLIAGAQAQTPSQAPMPTTAQKLLLDLSGQIRPAVDLNFTSGVLDSRITFTRASSETNSLYTDAAGSTFASFGNNVPVFQATGIQIYEARTNSLLNSAAPVTQTTASLGTGTYVFWCIGTGSVTSSAGTATATGLGAIACSQSTFQTIAVTVAGTLTFTDTGSINRFQLELGAFPTPLIVTTGTTATRSADMATMALASIGIPANPTGLTIIAKARTAPGIDATKGNNLFQFDDGTNANRILMRRNAATSNPIGTATAGGGGAQLSATLYAIPPVGTDLQFWFALAPSDAAAQVIGQTKQTSALMTSLPSGLTVFRIGTDLTSGAPWDSTIARLQIYNRRLPDATAARIAGGL